MRGPVRRSWFGRALRLGLPHLLGSIALAADPAAPTMDLATTGARFQPALTVTAETWHAPADSAVPSWWNTLVEVSGDFTTPDAEAGLYARAHWLSHRGGQPSLETATGAFNPISNIAAGRHVRLLSWYFHRAWQDGRYRIKLGQIALDDDFMLSEPAALFLNSAFGSLPTQVATPLCLDCVDVAYPEYPFAAPGVWFQYTSDRHWAAQSGIYFGSPGADVPANHGLEWNVHAHSGVVIFVEAAVPGGGGSGHVTRLGLACHTGRHEDYAALRDGHSDHSAQPLWSVYAIRDFTVKRNAAGMAVLTGFGRVGCSPQTSRSAVAVYADAGGNWFAPLPRRPDDVLGLAISWTRFSEPFRAVRGLHHTETIVELTYRATLTRHFQLSGDLQQIYAADAVTAVSRRHAITMVGLRGVLSY